MQKHAFVIEDHALTRWLLQELLEDEQYQVDTASDGRVALDKLESGTHPDYDIITLDITMPGMNGLQVLQAIRQRLIDLLPHIIVISGDEEALEQAGHMDVRTLKKPFDLSDLLTIISSILLNICKQPCLECAFS